MAGLLMMRRFSLVSLMAVAALSATPAGASAAEVIGQTAPGAPGSSCDAPQSYLQQSVSGGADYTPSSSGVITSWSTKAPASTTGQLQLLVLRPTGAANFFTVVHKDVLRTLSVANALNIYTGLRFPVNPGERIGLFVPDVAIKPCGFDVPSNLADRFSFGGASGAEPDQGSTINFSGLQNEFRVNASAVVEPDLDRDTFGDESQDKCIGTAGTANGCPSTVVIDKLKQKGDTKVKVTATVPGAGTLKVGSSSDPALASAAAKKNLKAVSKTLTATTKQQLKLTLKLTKSAIEKLEDAGKLKFKVKAVYTPIGGPPGSQTKKAKLKS